jgi:hypothetical protein
MRKLFLALGCMYVVGAMTMDFTPHHTPEQVVPANNYEPRCELPCRCRDLKREPDPDTWDPHTDTYPPNYEWEKCMGVR